jgi:nuclease S1
MTGKIVLLRAAVLVFALTLVPMREAMAWGAAGHAIIAEIAQRRLDPVALRKVKDLLGGEVSLAAIANLADTIAATRPETRNWHFVNIPVGATGYDPDRDCAATPHGDCIVKAIARFRAVLADAGKPKAERAEALVFLVHLVGDIHQPLHCAERNHDADASTLKVTFFGAPMSLHLVWDVGLIEKHTYDWGDYADHLQRDWLAGRDVAQLARGEPTDWAWEAHQAAIDVAYALPEDLNLGDSYFQHSSITVDRQLALAGVRLARLLNEALK